ncbi:hypothetical protein [Bifidobacterium vansinderenii]|uniref:Uncharacterized protein n=1 Tax=Bifidobacterium vansinderenii TaxID=1984871 RepID=A0A229W1A3_9BIFI|nr:hypothetical protein [Bifidobacterium vansinderenii]OXN01641.1 hypothetical protein Tam10B_0083 [Bifidobacterium vansinderenii]
MSIFTTEDEEISYSSIIHDYAHAWATDPDDIELRRHRIITWLANRDRKLLKAAAAQAWEKGVQYGMNVVRTAANSARVGPISENPYIMEENQ